MSVGIKRPRKKKDDVELQNQLLERAVDVLQETTRAESEGTKFGAYLGLKLDGFNPRQRAIAIKRINDIIFEIEMATSSFGVAPTANVPQSASPSPYCESRSPMEYMHPESYVAMLGYSHPNSGE